MAKVIVEMPIGGKKIYFLKVDSAHDEGMHIS